MFDHKKLILIVEKRVVLNEEKIINPLIVMNKLKHVDEVDEEKRKDQFPFVLIDFLE
jgi:putative ribosome biogenesis GTPase RsgA